jgi:hypothetical protein
LRIRIKPIAAFPIFFRDGIYWMGKSDKILVIQKFRKNLRFIEANFKGNAFEKLMIDKKFRKNFINKINKRFGKL